MTMVPKPQPFPGPRPVKLQARRMDRAKILSDSRESVGKILADIMDNRETFNMTSEMHIAAQEHFTGSGCNIRITGLQPITEG